ncbi:hypothetical protein CEXT_346681 [Caerostris extrusa]|uniref:Uncharacterized protein n=1 Tax=Caerostris extrusa TaxID=172846 RepID=A0AAV4NYB3_CAEEX|nr:hypothetical protein CEXT_346681 [Caerostris extrusa]
MLKPHLTTADITVNSNQYLSELEGPPQMHDPSIAPTKCKQTKNLFPFGILSRSIPLLVYKKNFSSVPDSIYLMMSAHGHEDPGPDKYGIGFRPAIRAHYCTRVSLGPR